MVKTSWKVNHKYKKMKKTVCLFFAMTYTCITHAQKLPCSNPQFRQFDFWIGEWEAFGVKGAKAGDSKITVLLDSCVILEEWTSAGAQQGLIYTGKSFNSYNTATKQWQQTWTDNTGNTTEFLRGEGSEGKIIYYADKVGSPDGKIFMRRLTFTKLSNDKVRQLGERSDDDGKTWATEYDLEYRRKMINPAAIADTVLKKMEIAYNSGNFNKIADYYSNNAKIVNKVVEASGREQIQKYWAGFAGMAGTWKLINEKTEKTGEQIWQKGTSVIMDKMGKKHKVNFTLVFIYEEGKWKILQDSYWQ
jgi:ketosteroid isomerase-like protein